MCNVTREKMQKNTFIYKYIKYVHTYISTRSRAHVASLEKSYFEVINYTYILFHPAPLKVLF